VKIIKVSGLEDKYDLGGAYNDNLKSHEFMIHRSSSYGDSRKKQKEDKKYKKVVCGYKLHISTHPENLQKVADKVLPILCKLDLWHKYVASLELYLEFIKYNEGIETGKFITIYPSEPWQGSFEVKTILYRIKKLDLPKGPNISEFHKEEEEWIPNLVYARSGFW